ncbi:MAG: hypothetical protein ACAH83_08215 [Alphaproteobacteria bacterium]
MPIFPNPAKAVEKLAQAYKDVGKIADPIERLLGYRDTAASAAELHSTLDISRMYPALCGVLAFTYFGISAAAVVTFLPLAPFFGMMGGMTAWMMAKVVAACYGFSDDAMAKAESLRVKSQGAIDDLTQNIDARNLPHSSHFDKVMTNFPALKERFVAAAAREILQKPAPAPVKTAGFPGPNP